MSRGERIRLYVSYQRYAILIFSIWWAVLAFILWYDPWAWYLWVPAVPALFWGQGFGREVASRWPRKLRLTEEAHAALEAGTFEVDSLQNYCGDPCFRVVAHEILSTAGYDEAQRQALVQEMRSQIEAERETVYIFDHNQGVIYETRGAETRVVPMTQSSP